MRRLYLALIALLAVAVALTARVLVANPALVLSHISTDLANYFYPVRAFVTERLRAGDIPFFNPHIFAGVPFVGGFQSAVFYPGNVLFFVLPLEAAINASIVIHLFLGGAFVLFAAYRRGAGGGGALLAGLVFLLGGPLFPHVWAGHLSLLWTAPWAILTLVAIDALLDGAGARWVVAGAIALAFALLAGHPQTVFHAGVAAMIWIALRWSDLRQRPRAGWAIGASVLLGAGIAAVQLWPAIAESPFGIRTALSPNEAAVFSLPPESLLTLFSSSLFGAGPDAPYWGRGYFWEMSLFVGASVLPLLLLGACVPTGGRRMAAAAVVLLLLALGANGPFYALLQGLPAFDRIRGWSKFTLPFLFFAAMLVALGLQRLREVRTRGLVLVLFLLLAIVLVSGGMALKQSAADGDAPPVFRNVVAAIQDAAAARGEAYLPQALRDDATFLADAAVHAGDALVRAAAFLALGTALLFLSRRWPVWATRGFVVIAGVELATTAMPLVVAFDPEPLRFVQLKELLASRAPEVRILNTIVPNSAMMFGAHDIGGYDPAIPRRTAEFLEFSQERSPDTLSQFPRFRSIPSLFALLRFDLALFVEEGRLQAVGATVPAMPRVSLLDRFEVVVPRDSLLVRLSDATFEFQSTVLLEEEPRPSPQAGGALGSAAVVEDRGDVLILKASAPAPAVLLMTDAYHPFWSARALPGSVQDRYDVLPADHMLRAIPLEAGEHHLELSYRVPGFMTSVIVSGISIALTIALALGVLRRRGAGATA